MSIDTDERFAAELSGQLRRIATGLTPGQEIETAVGVRAAARARRRTVARATAGGGVVLLVVAGIGWVGTRPTEPAEPTNPSGFSAPDVVFPVVDEALLPADLSGQLQQDVSTTDPGQWTGTLTGADGRTDSMVIVVMRPSSESSPLDGYTPRRADVTEFSTGDRGTHLEFRRAGFDLRLVSFDVDFAYTLVDRIVPSATGVELADDATAPAAVWLTRPYEIPTSAAALYSDDLNALDITVEQMPISLIRRFLCEPSTNSPTTCVGASGDAVLVELDATHTLMVSSKRLTTEELSRIAAAVRFVTFDEWNSEGLPAPTTVAPIDPEAVWPLLDEAAVPSRLSPATQPDLAWWPTDAYFGSVGNSVDDGTSPQTLTMIALHPRADEERPDAVPGRTEGVTESPYLDAVALTKDVGADWELTVVGDDLDQSYDVLDAIDIAFDEKGGVTGYVLSALRDGLREVSPGGLVPAGSSPRLGVGDTNPITIQTVPLPLQTTLGMQLTTLQGSRTSTATTINGRNGFLIEGLPAGTRQLILQVTPTDTLVMTASGEITIEELLAVTHGVSFGTQADWEARYGVTVRELEQELSTTTDPG